MATGPAFPFSIVSVVEDVIQKHGSSLSDINLATRKAQEACKYRISSFFDSFPMFSFNSVVSNIDSTLCVCGVEL